MILIFCLTGARDKEVSECRKEVLLSQVGVSACVESCYCISSYEATDYNVCEALTSGLSLSGRFASSNTLRLSAATTVAYLLSAPDSRLRESERKHLCPGHAFVKPPCQYYVYTLEHILI